MNIMKDSGIEWIGECPEHWNAMPSKFLMKKLKLIQPIYSGEDILSLTINGVIKRDLENPSGKMPTSFDGYQIVYPNNLLMCLFDIDVTPRCVGIIKDYGLTSPAYSQFVLNERANTRYYYYYYLNLDYTKELLHLAKNQRHSLNEEQFGAIPTIVPPIDEQKKIAEFLDKKCEEVDGLIADIQKQIDTLEQYKRSTITEAVTKGLNPTAEMKDSNIQWVGKIPAHWGSLPIYVLFEEVTKKNIFGKEKQALQFRYGTIVLKENFEADDDLYVAKTILNYNIVEPGVIMLNGLNLNFDFVTQRVALVRDKGIITSAYMAIKSKNFNAMNPEYSTYLLKSYDICKAFHNMGGGVRKILNFEELKRNYIIVPPIDEQKSIANYLDKKCEEIDACIEEKKQQISVLETYKKSIIFEYVTGKKEVM